MNFRLKSKGGVYIVNDVDKFGLGAGVSELIVKSGLATRRHNAVVKIVSATLALRASGLDASEEPKFSFADLLPYAERTQGPGMSGIVPDIAFVDSDGTRRLAEVKAISSLPQWYKTKLVEKTWRGRSGVDSRARDSQGLPKTRCCSRCQVLLRS